MRSKFTLPIALCALLGIAAAAPVAANPVHYTDTAAIQVQPMRTVQIAIDRTFTLDERAKILRAVNECDATAGAPQAHAWTVARIDSRNPMVGTAAMKRTLALKKLLRGDGSN